MATVIGNVVLFVVTWLLTWALLMIVYLGLLEAVDYLRAGWQQYQRVRRYRRALAAELARIDRETAAAVQRISSAFMLAQRLIREQADVDRRRRAS